MGKANDGQRDTIMRLNASRTPEERKEAARKAGLASAQARRDRRSLYEITHEMLQEIDGSGQSRGQRMMSTHLDKAIAGDINSATFVAKVDRSLGTQLEVGNLDGRPFETINLAELTDEQLAQLLEKQEDNGNE